MTKHLIDPQIVSLLDLLPQLELSEATLSESRQQLANMVPPCDLPRGISKTEHRTQGGIRVVAYMPAVRKAAGAIFHIHGGGMIMGTPEMNEARNAALALDLGCPIASVDYRLAPETPAPGNVEDCLAGLTWFHGKAAEWRFDSNRIVVLGESAGGGLAAATGVLARDRGGPPIALLALVYPMLDDRTVLDKEPNACGEFIWTAESNLFGWNCLLQGKAGAVNVSAYGAPARVATVSGLPSTYICVGALDLFAEENLAFAARLARGGIPIELHVYPGAFHGFDMMPDVDLTRRFNADLVGAMRRALA